MSTSTHVNNFAGLEMYTCTHVYFRMKIYAFTNQKGGVGKTTSCANIGVGLAMTQRRTLLIDLDPQSNLTTCLGLKAGDTDIYDVLRGRAKIKDIVLSRALQIHHEGEPLTIDVAPASLALSGADIELSTVISRETLLKRALKEVEAIYDYVLIDCAPSLGLLTGNALTAADQVLVPVQAEYLSLEGLAQLLQALEQIKVINPGIGVGGVIVTMYDKRRILNNEVKQALEERFGNEVFKTPIRENIKLAEAPSAGLSIFEYDGQSFGAQDYAAVVGELIQKEMSYV